MDNAKTQFLDMGFKEEQITNAINSTNSNDIGVFISINTYNPQPQSEQQQQQAQQLDSISKYVNEKHVAILITEGVDAAIKWIEEHKNDQDFEEELQIVDSGKKISPKEAAFKARELQQKLREKRRIAGEQAAFEQEKNRIAYYE